MKRALLWLRDHIVIVLFVVATVVVLGSAPVIEDGAQLIADDAAATPGEVAHDEKVARAAP
ncbi:hypothetical protein BH10PSE18_BH10PSE18_15040 [soil metagenome]